MFEELSYQIGRAARFFVVVEFKLEPVGPQPFPSLSDRITVGYAEESNHIMPVRSDFIPSISGCKPSFQL
mgnify:CR=1 FL=1